MNERLNRLRFSLGVNWGELAQKLEISRSMLGFIRSGIKDPGPKLKKRISDLEKETGSHTVATCENCEILLNRVIELEAQVLELDEMMLRRSKVVVKLTKEFDKFRKDYTKMFEDESDIQKEKDKE